MAARYGVGGQRIPRSFPGAVAWRGNDLYVASGTGTIEQWDPDNGRRLRTLGTGYPAAIDLQFVDDGTTLVISGVSPSAADGAMAYDADTGAARWDTPEGLAGMIAEDPRHDAVIVTNPYSGATTMAALRSVHRRAHRHLRLPARLGVLRGGLTRRTGPRRLLL